MDLPHVQRLREHPPRFDSRACPLLRSPRSLTIPSRLSRQWRGPMLVATFSLSSSCPGRIITFEDGRFPHEILGELSPADVMAHDRRGDLVSPMDGMRSWVGSRAGIRNDGEPAAPARTAASPRQSASASGSWAAACPARARLRRDHRRGVPEHQSEHPRMMRGLSRSGVVG